MVAFAQNLYLWRIFRGLSQQKLAERSGIPRPNISAIESGKREVSLSTLRLLASCLRITPGALVNGIAPIHYKGDITSRESLEKIVQASLGRNKAHLTPQQKDISASLSRIIRNRVNAGNKIYKDISKDRQAHINDWLVLKTALGREALNSLLARIDKHIELERRMALE